MAHHTHVNVGEDLHALAARLFPICRSITGHGLRQSLAILGEHLPGLECTEVPSGTKCFDWTIPPEWNIRDAWVIDPTGNKIIDFQACNLHVVGYSIPVDLTMSLEELQLHLYSLPEAPDAVPYVTAYYGETWGICLSQLQRDMLRPGNYRVVIDSTLEPGSLTYGELVLPGQSEEEVFLSTYFCHPSMGNNELSGPAVATYLAKWLSGLENRRYTYRFVFAPETIGAITYISRNLASLVSNVVAAFNLTCCGDDRMYSFMPSRNGNTLTDRVARHVLGHIAPDYEERSFLDRGSDERQYCAPGVDLPMVSMMRSMYRTYPEYHTSKDDLSFITSRGLEGGFLAHVHALECLEANVVPRATLLCEPHLDQHGLFPKTGQRSHNKTIRTTLDVLAYADGSRDLLSIAEILNQPLWEVEIIVRRLAEKGILALSEGTYA